MKRREFLGAAAAVPAAAALSFTGQTSPEIQEKPVDLQCWRCRNEKPDLTGRWMPGLYFNNEEDEEFDRGLWMGIVILRKNGKFHRGKRWEKSVNDFLRSAVDHFPDAEAVQLQLCGTTPELCAIWEYNREFIDSLISANPNTGSKPIQGDR